MLRMKVPKNMLEDLEEDDESSSEEVEDEKQSPH
jgi:hypothetical protein